MKNGKVITTILIIAVIIIIGYALLKPKKQAQVVQQPVQARETPQKQAKVSIPEDEESDGGISESDDDENHLDEMMNDEEQGVEQNITEGPVDITQQQEQAAGIKTTTPQNRQIFLSLKSTGTVGQASQQEIEAGTIPIKAQIYEGEESLAKPGQKAQITTAVHQGKKFTGILSQVEETKDPNNKILKATIEAANRAGLLKPGMEIEAVIYVDLGQRLCVPNDSIFDTGDKDVVFLKKAPGKYEPAEVETGYENDDYTEIESGVKEGDAIAASTTALIDLKTKLEAEAESNTKTAK